ncbi:MAG: MotA/TolQ/ExbB proton channel family protein, partial [Phycisphaerales bacterium]
MTVSFAAQVAAAVLGFQDTTAAPAPAPHGRTLLEYIQSGGFLSYVLIALSITAVALVIINVIKNRMEAWAPPASVELLGRMLRDGDIESVKRYCASPENDNFVANVIGNAILRCSRSSLGFLELRSALEEAGGQEVERRYRSLESIALIAALGPMLGLLGTVIGLIGAFGTLSQVEGAARSKELADFMSLALVNTAEGLAVAIPCTAFYSIFRRRVDRLALEAGLIIEGLTTPLEQRLGAAPAPRAAAPGAQDRPAPVLRPAPAPVVGPQG